MTDIHTAAAAILNSAGVATSGVDLFVYDAPPTATHFALILPDLEGIAEDENLPGYYQTGLSVVVRDDNFPAALAKATAISAALNLHEHDAGEIRIKRIRPTHKPMPYRVPQSDAVEASVNLWACYCETT